MKFTSSHEWIQLEGSVATIGLSDYAQQELGEIVFTQLPQVGDKVEPGQEIAIVESTKAASDIYTPIGGEIVEVNSLLLEDPSLINRSAQRDGWLVKINVSSLKSLDSLLTQEQYLSLLI